MSADSNPTTSSTTNGNAQGTWEFSGWTTTDETENVQNDVHYTGYWTFKEAAKHNIVIHYVDDTSAQNKLQDDLTISQLEGSTYNVADKIPNRIGDYVKESMNGSATGTVNGGDVTIIVVYTKDVLVDSTVPKPDGPGDNIPDKYQVIVKYVPDTTGRGTVGQLTEEVLTIYKDKEKNVYASEGQVTASGSTATATGSSRNYFSNWTNDAGLATSYTAALGQQTFTAEGGKTYTFTANFGRSSGGSNRPKPPVVEIPDDVPTGLNGKDHYAYVVGYPDGMVYPQKNITRAEVATIFFRLLKDETREANMTKSNSYNDMKDGAWYTCAVSTLSKMGIIKGYEDGSFKPDASISRAEFAAIAARFDPDGDTTPATFSDVSSHWAKDEISIAANHGWIKGYEDGSFKPDQKITRAETMTLVNRVLKRLPETKDDLHKDMKTWPDNQNESAWFYLAVQEATNSHYQKLKKDGTHETWESMRETRDWAALEK
ncbi:MAG: S-layer homology domain-containing protein [Evtepia sp.]|nr:S-layer homology domain-containing protein [Evtepia sp.]